MAFSGHYDRAVSEPREPRLSLRHSDVRARSFNEETIVLDLRSSVYLSTNPAGTILWQQLERGTTRSRMIEALVDEFQIDPERAGADVDAFLDDCWRRELIVAADQPPAPGADG